MTIKVRTLVQRLREASKDEENVGLLGLLLEEAATVITNQQDDLEALRRQGTDHA